MSLLDLGLIFVISLLAVRTLCAHLQSWQLREYRWDRMRGYLRTSQGQKNIWNLWFFPGTLPRPKITGRILLIVGLTAVINGLLWFSLILNTGYLILGALILERLLWLTVALSVFISQIPVNFKRKQTFKQAGAIIHAADTNIIKIGIAGSFGKSSTKNILVHLLTELYGAENLLYTPENLNQELAIARLIIKERNFFQTKRDQPRFFVFETAAYSRGEIKQIAQAAKPHYALMTGLNSQHLETFGSLENTKKAKCELVESTTEKAFYNADNQLMCEGMDAVETKAEKVGASLSQISDIKEQITETKFVYQEQEYSLPWPGAFFVSNALLCLNLIKDLPLLDKEGGRGEDLSSALSSLPPQPKALQASVHPQGFTLLQDLYSQNPDGTLKAVEHLGKWEGRKVFIGMPFLELAEETENAHRDLFQALKNINAEVYWTKEDYADLGREILGDEFHCLTDPLDISSYDKNTAVLLEGRLPQPIVKTFEA